ncbi:hypothetical protein [Pseudomonas fluorescens]|uniref:Uncharacterized protein n=1 Tax=Pseudomonas fluorescens TaxID=294 RepID=A0A5E6WNB9_PSEFL|nr:hypothetical protein [Pseudomonas fluorescens]VVN30140.1 hypothetical protein PS655_04823 [Pseudomonas fluorescens]
MDDHQSVALSANALRPRQLPVVGSFDWHNSQGKVRNISAGIEGLPLILRLGLVDAMTGEPVSGAVVRIEQRIGTDILCGSQSTDSKGIVRFTSLYPDRHTAFTCIALSVAIASDDQQPQSYQEAWAGRLHLPCVWNCTAVDDDAVRLALRPLADDDPEDGYFGSLTIGVDTFAVSSQIGVAGYDKYLITVF